MKRALLVAACAAAACSAASIATEPNVAGLYSVSIVDGANPCSLPGWTERQAAQGVALSFAQDPTNNANISAVVGGDAGAYVAALTGTPQLCGVLGGNQASLTTGSCPDAGPTDAMARLDGCSFGVTATLTANFQYDTVQGTVSYGVSSPTGKACPQFGGCQSVQAFSGVILPADAGSPDSAPDSPPDALRPSG
ncbi:MAG TPA: hypothetical protein VF765_26545 [Polyangiaceae bacterium]